MRENVVYLHKMIAKSIRVYEHTYNDLFELGRYGESMSDIINKCIKAYKEQNKHIVNPKQKKIEVTT